MKNAAFVAIILTMGFTKEPDDVGRTIGQFGKARTLGYAAAGLGGMPTLVIRAVMRNRMASTGVVAAVMSTSVSGKVVATWVPVLVLFRLRFKRSIANPLLLPSGSILAARSPRPTFSTTRSRP